MTFSSLVTVNLYVNFLKDLETEKFKVC